MKDKKDTSAQFCVVLEESASALTQGGWGQGTEDRFAWKWPS